MLQKDLLLEHKTVLGNIILPLLIQKVDKAEAIARADKILATFQLTAVRDKYPHELSGGMRQRVALLRTYLFGHKLFLLDEAFSALDEMTKMELHAWYLEIHKQLQLTTIDYYAQYRGGPQSQRSHLYLEKSSWADCFRN